MCYLKGKIKHPFVTLKKKIKAHIYVKKQIRELSMSYKKCTGSCLDNDKKQLLAKIFKETIEKQLY